MSIINALEQALHNKNLSREECLQQVCVSVQALVPQANMVSLWRFNGDKSSIISLINYDATTQTFSKELVLSKTDFPSYFDTILETELIVASEARVHSATKCFNEIYFKPNNIFSLLDFILQKDYQPVGVICCESKDKQAIWTQSDIEHIRMIAVLISFFFDV